MCSKDLSREVQFLSLLECPGCLETRSPDGHDICRGCKEKTHTGPQCQATYLPARSPDGHICRGCKEKTQCRATYLPARSPNGRDICRGCKEKTRADPQCQATYLPARSPDGHICRGCKEKTQCRATYLPARSPNGRDICRGCKEKTRSGPQCQATYLPARSLTAGRLSDKVEEDLLRRECRAGKGILGVPKCGWSGDYRELADHVRAKHPRFVLNGHDKSIVHTTLPPSSHHRECLLVEARGGMFWFNSVRDAQDNFKVAVQCVGPSVGDARRYKYEVRLTSDGGWTASYCDFTRGDGEDVNVVFRSRLCFSVEGEKVRDAMVDNSFNYRLLINKSSYY